jgi:hypothetical protein
MNAVQESRPRTRSILYPEAACAVCTRLEHGPFFAITANHRKTFEIESKISCDLL